MNFVHIIENKNKRQVDVVNPDHKLKLGYEGEQLEMPQENTKEDWVGGRKIMNILG